ncbi:MAG: hypothetical protein V4538_00930 [Bacteroidota bacterium]
MFKFLIYLFIFYAASRFIFGTLFNFKQSYTAAPKFDQDTDDSEVKVNGPSTANKKTKGNSSNMGEYVDFEEIK